MKHLSKDTTTRRMRELNQRPPLTMVIVETTLHPLRHAYFIWALHRYDYRAVMESSTQPSSTSTCLENLRVRVLVVIGAGSRVPGGAQAPPELFLAPPEPFEPPLTIEKIMH